MTYYSMKGFGWVKIRNKDISTRFSVSKYVFNRVGDHVRLVGLPPNS